MLATTYRRPVTADELLIDPDGLYTAAEVEGMMRDYRTAEAFARPGVEKVLRGWADDATPSIPVPSGPGR